MKFRDPKTGEVLEAIGAARARACSGHACDDCPVGQFNQGELYGDTCAKFVKEYPTVAARLMGLEVVEESFAERLESSAKKEEPMDKMDKPRICEVLGVEVGEVFTADTPYGRFQRCVIDEEGRILNTGTNVLCYMLNHPDRIIRKPRFTEEEVADAKAILRILPHVDTVERMENGLLYCYDREMEQVNICGRLFPSLRPGQTVRLEDIT